VIVGPILGAVIYYLLMRSIIANQPVSDEEEPVSERLREIGADR
jgi:hypothetical protein